MFEITKQIQREGVLTGKLFLKIELSGEIELNSLLDEINKHNCSFLEFNGDSLPNGIDVLVAKLKEQGKFITVKLTGNKWVDISWDYVTLILNLNNISHDILDKYLGLKTKLQVIIGIKTLSDVMNAEKLLRRHYLVRKRRIPAIFLINNPEIIKSVTDQNYFSEYNYRIMIAA